MGKLVDGDDGLPVEEVGRWAIDKQDALCRYIGISGAARKKWLGPNKSGATYIDLFSGPGRSKIRKTGQFIDGSCVAAWKESVRVKAPFSKVYIADADEIRRGYATERLRRLGAPVFEIPGDALDAAQTLRSQINPTSLHFAFLDPYNLAAFDFAVIEHLAKYMSIDILVHISKMDLQRNVGINVGAQKSAFDAFAPDWRLVVDENQSFTAIRQGVFNHWRSKVASLGIAPSADMKLVRGSKSQPLYWLTLVARNELAHKFWKTASRSDQQGDLGL